MFKRIHISIGSRIIKTSASAGIAMFITEALGLDFSTLAVAAAVMTLQPTFHETLDMAKRRMLGAFIGTVIAIPCVYLFRIHPAIEIFAGVLIILTLSNALSLTTSSVLGVFAFVSIVSFPEATYITMLDRILNTAIGAGTSIVINAIFPVQSITNKSESIMERALSNDIRLLQENLKRIVGLETQELVDFRALTNDTIKELSDAYNTGDLLRKEQRFAGVSDIYRKFEEKYRALWIIHNCVLQIQIDSDLFAEGGYALSAEAASQVEGLAEYLSGLKEAETVVPKGTRKAIGEFISALENVLTKDLEVEHFSAIDDEISFYTVFLSNLNRFADSIEEFESK